MPRKTPVKELLKEEEVPSSPLRRSSRISNNSPVPTRVLTRRSSASETSTSTTTKATRSRRSSLSQEPEATNDSDKKKTTTIRTRRSSLTQNSEERVTDEAAQKTKSRGSSVPKETTEVKRTTRGRKSISEDAESTEKLATSRSGSLTKKTEDNKVAKKLKDVSTSTPVKKSAASSSSDPSEHLETVEEGVKKEVDSPEKSVKKRQTDVKVELDLSVINEVSLTEDEISPQKKSVVMDKSNADQSGQPGPKQNKETVVEIINDVEKSKGKSEKPALDTAKDDSENEMSDTSVSDHSFRLELDDSQSETGNKENICPPERVSECEPMEVDDSPQVESAPIKKTVKSRLSLIKKVTEVESKLQDAEKVTNDIKEFLEEENKLTPESKQQITSDETSVISETSQTKTLVSTTKEKRQSENVFESDKDQSTITKIITQEKIVDNETETISLKENNDALENKVVALTTNHVEEVQEHAPESKDSLSEKCKTDISEVEREQLSEKLAIDKNVNSENNEDVSHLKKDDFVEKEQKSSHEHKDIVNTSLKDDKLSESLTDKNSAVVNDISITSVLPKNNSSQLEIKKNEAVATLAESHATASMEIDHHKDLKLETSKNETDVCDTKTDEKKIPESETEKDNSVNNTSEIRKTNEKDELDLEVETINKSRAMTEEQNSEFGEEQVDLCESESNESKENDYSSPVKKLKVSSNTHDDLDQSTDSKYSATLKPDLKKPEINSSQIDQNINTDTEMDCEQDNLNSSQNEQRYDNGEKSKLNETTEKDDSINTHRDRKRSSDRTSITLQEIVKVGEEKTVNERIHKVVDLFCAGIKNNADISINVSLEYTGQMTDSEDEKTDLLEVSLTASNLVEKEPEHQKRSKRRKICNDEISSSEKFEEESVAEKEFEMTSPTKKRNSFGISNEQEKLLSSSAKKIKTRNSLPERNETKIKDNVSSAKKRSSLNTLETVSSEKELSADNFSDESEVDDTDDENVLEDSKYNILLSKSFEDSDVNDTTWKSDDEEVSSSAESDEEESIEDEDFVVLEDKLNESGNQTTKKDSPKREAKKSPNTSKEYHKELPSPIRNVNNSITIVEKNSSDTSAKKTRRKSVSHDSSLHNTSPLVQNSSAGENSAQKRKKKMSSPGNEITEHLDSERSPPKKKIDGSPKHKEKTSEIASNSDTEQSDDECDVSNSNLTNLLSATLQDSDANDTTWKPDQEDNDSFEDEGDSSSSISSDVFVEGVVDQTVPKKQDNEKDVGKKTGSAEGTKRSKKNKTVGNEQKNTFEETKHVKQLVPEVSEIRNKKRNSKKRKRADQETTSVKSDNEEFGAVSKTKKKPVKDLREKLNMSREDNVSYVRPSTKASSGWYVGVL